MPIRKMLHLRANADAMGIGILVSTACLLLGACSDPPARSDAEFDYDVPTRVAQLVPSIACGPMLSAASNR